MSIQAVGWVLSHEHETKGSERLVLLSIANHADDQWESWPSLDTIAAESNVHTQSVRTALRRLVERGVIERVVNGGGTHRTRADRRPNLYRIVRERGEQITPPVEQRGGSESLTTGGANHSPEPSVEPSTALDRVPTGAVAARELVAAFKAFWSQYPRKVGKPAAERAWRAHVIRGGVQPDNVLTGLDAWCAYWTARDEPQFVPHPSTWLNQHRWDDEPPPLPKTRERQKVLDVLDGIDQNDGVAHARRLAR